MKCTIYLITSLAVAIRSTNHTPVGLEGIGCFSLPHKTPEV